MKWLVGLLFVAGCGSPEMRVTPPAPKSDCEWVLKSCLQGKKKSKYTKEFCEKEYDKCENGTIEDEFYNE